MSYVKKREPNPSALNPSLMGGANGMFLDFVVPHPQDPPFAAPAAFEWRPNTASNNLMMPNSRCTHHNHPQQNFMHQIHHHHNGIGYFPSNSTLLQSLMEPCVDSYMGSSGDNCNTPLSHFVSNECSGRGSPFSSSVGHNDFGCGDGLFTMKHKIFIPHHPSYNFIGRILGPRGNSVRCLEALTGCKILIRGRGSIKDSNYEERMRNTPGWEHLNEDLHVLITAEDIKEYTCHQKLCRAAISIQRLLKPQFDEYKRQQLIQLAIINGTYRP